MLIASVNGQSTCLEVLASRVQPCNLVKGSDVTIKNKDDFIWRTRAHLGALTDNVDNVITDTVHTRNKFHVGDLLIHQVGTTVPNLELLGKRHACLVFR